MAAILPEHLSRVIDRILNETSFYVPKEKVSKLSDVLKGLTPGETVTILDVIQELLESLADLEEEVEALKNRLLEKVGEV